jgi:hypothetical protein
MKFAFHKERVTLFEKLCSWKMEGPYTHVEALFGPDPVNPKLTVCGSSKYTEGGVRLTSLDFSDTSLWDIVEVPGIDEDKALQWFKDHAGEPYDTRGLFQFITFFPVGHNPKGWFCDEACLAAIGMEGSYRFDPNGMAAILNFLKLYEAGNKAAAIASVKAGEIDAVKKPETPLAQIEDKLKKAIPVVEDVAQAAEVAAPIIAMIPGGAAVAAVIGVVAPVVDKVANAAPTVEHAIQSVKELV